MDLNYYSAKLVHLAEEIFYFQCRKHYHAEESDKISREGAGQLALPSRAFAALTEDLRSIP